MLFITICGLPSNLKEGNTLDILREEIKKTLANIEILPIPIEKIYVYFSSTMGHSDALPIFIQGTLDGMSGSDILNHIAETVATRVTRRCPGQQVIARICPVTDWVGSYPKSEDIYLRRLGI